MLEAADPIIAYTERGRDAFDSDAALRDAILYQIVVLGEASKATLAADPSIGSAQPEVEWTPIARMRDRVAHHHWATEPRGRLGDGDRSRTRSPQHSTTELYTRDSITQLKAVHQRTHPAHRTLAQRAPRRGSEENKLLSVLAAEAVSDERAGAEE
jgi:hypothetical protein